MKIIKFIITSLLLFMPIGVFAGGCEDYTEADCPYAADSGCYWEQGYTDEFTGEKTEAQCKQCDSGYYPDAEKTGCELCPVGHYCEDGVKEPCPYNRYSDSEGASICTPCPAGTRSDRGAISCTKCSPGTYGYREGNGCSYCNYGHYCPGEGMIKREECPAGTYTPSDTTGYSECLNCTLPTGTGGGDAFVSGPTARFLNDYDREFLKENLSVDVKLTANNTDSCPFVVSCSGNTFVKFENGAFKCEPCPESYEYISNPPEHSNTVYYYKGKGDTTEDAVYYDPNGECPNTINPITLNFPESHYYPFPPSDFYQPICAVKIDNKWKLATRRSGKCPSDPDYYHDSVTGFGSVSFPDNQMLTAENFCLNNDDNLCFKGTGCGGRSSACTITVTEAINNNWEPVSGTTSVTLYPRFTMPDMEMLIMAITDQDIKVSDDGKVYVRLPDEGFLKDLPANQFSSGGASGGGIKFYNGKYKDVGMICAFGSEEDTEWYNVQNKKGKTCRELGLEEVFLNSSTRYDYIVSVSGTIDYGQKFCLSNNSSNCTVPPKFMAAKLSETKDGFYLELPISNKEDLKKKISCDGKSIFPDNPKNIKFGSGIYPMQEIPWNVNGLQIIKDEANGQYVVVGLFYYTPCAAGCYCTTYATTACPPAFTSDEGSSKRTDCYLKSDIKFYESGSGLIDLKSDLAIQQYGEIDFSTLFLPAQ